MPKRSGHDITSSPAERRRRRKLLALGLLLSLAMLLGLTWSGALETTSTRLGRELQQSVQEGLRRVVNVFLGPVHVGLQIGHAHAQQHPAELADLRASTGGYANGVSEVALNRAVAQAVKEKLEPYDIIVNIIPATVPPDYHADLFMSIHADSNADPDRRGYKSAHFKPPRNPREDDLKRHLDRAYLEYSGLPSDKANISGSMNYYYAFNFRHFEHSVHAGTPAVIVELGYISNPLDMAYLSDPERPASALAAGILSYLRDRGRIAGDTKP